MTDLVDDHITEAFDRLEAVYGSPKTENPVAFMAEFRAALDGYSPRSLQLAVTAWIRKDTPFWPRPGELAAECRRVLANPLHRPPVPIGPPRDDPRPERSKEDYQRVDQLAKQAIEALSTVKPTTSNIPEVKVDWEKGQRPQFEAMRAASPNRFHRRKA